MKIIFVLFWLIASMQVAKTQDLYRDSILFYTANMVQGMQPAIIILLLMTFFLFFSLFIQSTSGLAVLTMPILGALAVIVNIPEGKW